LSLQVLYSRLSLFKGIAAKLATQRPGDDDDQQVAAADEVEHASSSFADLMNLPDRNANAEHFYDLLLESCERLFDNELEQPAFEDQMRSMFGTKVSCRKGLEDIYAEDMFSGRI
jgi:paired amphipathic helix protein Sin3a